MSGDGDRKRGAVLLSALGVLVLSFLFLGSFMTLNALRAGSIRQDARTLRAYYAARAGAEAGRFFLTRASQGEEASDPGMIRLKGGKAPAAGGEKFFIHFHERGEGNFSGRVFDDARCEVSWERVRRTEAGDEYIIRATGIIERGGAEESRYTVYAYARERNGILSITKWYE